MSFGAGWGGGDVATKVAVTPAERDRLAQEKAVLQAAIGVPGVIRLAAEDRDGVLVTHAIGTAGIRSFADIDPALLTPAELASLVATLAERIAGLHAVGLVHGGVEASHVLLDQRRGVVLCSLGRGGAVGEDGRSFADDVFALGQLITAALGLSAPGEDDPWDALRQGRPRARSWYDEPTGSGILDRLDRLALQATDPDPDERPSAAGLAGVIRRRHPEVGRLQLDLEGLSLDTCRAGAILDLTGAGVPAAV